MAIYVKGTAVENAERYTLYEKSGETYTALTTGTEINFALDGLGLAAGDHVLVVKARADGYTDSEYSNEVTYTVEDSSLPFTVPLENVDALAWYLGANDAMWYPYASSTPYKAQRYDISSYRGRTITVTRNSNYNLRFAMIVDDEYAEPASGKTPTLAGGGTYETDFIRYGSGTYDMSDGSVYTTTIPDDAAFMVINCHASGTDFNHTVVIS